MSCPDHRPSSGDQAAAGQQEQPLAIMWFELLLIAAFLTPSLVLMALMNPQLFRDSPARRTVVVLVLGDIGRSPRMMYHAESFAKLGWETYLVGYAGE